MHPDANEPSPPVTQHANFSLERISQLVSDLEQELAQAPAGAPGLDALREEINALKHTLANSGRAEDDMEQTLHRVRNSLSELASNVENEVLKDTPYLTEIGRILGLI